METLLLQGGMGENGESLFDETLGLRISNRHTFGRYLGDPRYGRLTLTRRFYLRVDRNHRSSGNSFDVFSFFCAKGFASSF